MATWRPSMSRAIAILMVATLASVGARRAAGDDAFPVGSRVRMLAPSVSGKPFVGQLLASDEATLTGPSR